MGDSVSQSVIVSPQSTIRNLFGPFEAVATVSIFTAAAALRSSAVLDNEAFVVFTVVLDARRDRKTVLWRTCCCCCCYCCYCRRGGGGRKGDGGMRHYHDASLRSRSPNSEVHHKFDQQQRQQYEQKYEKEENDEGLEVLVLL